MYIGVDEIISIFVNKLDNNICDLEELQRTRTELIEWIVWDQSEHILRPEL